MFDTGRLARVIDTVASASGWPHAPSAGRAWGIAAHFTFGSYAAEAAEVSVRNGIITVHRVVAALDCGTVVNLSGAEAQVQGGIIDGLSAALFGEVTIDAGRVTQRNFADYRLLRIDEAPAHRRPLHSEHAKHRADSASHRCRRSRRRWQTRSSPRRDNDFDACRFKKR